jgi:hypothetical protein
MARYTVRAEAVKTGGDPAKEQAFLIVQVEDEDGQAVQGLTKSSFRVWVHFGGAFSQTDVDFFSESLADTPTVQLPGVYVLKLDWIPGPVPATHALGVHVRSPRGVTPQATGEAICKLINLVP